jgi:hypothetical protein
MRHTPAKYTFLYDASCRHAHVLSTSTKCLLMNAHASACTRTILMDDSGVRRHALRHSVYAHLHACKGVSPSVQKCCFACLDTCSYACMSHARVYKNAQIHAHIDVCSLINICILAHQSGRPACHGSNTHACQHICIHTYAPVSPSKDDTFDDTRICL